MRRFLKFNKIFGLLPVFMAAVLINATPAMAGGTISFEKVDIGFNSAIGAGFVQDRDGFFWIGTQTGLIKWNGTDRVIYSRSRGGLSDNTITAVVEDHKGQLWVGTMGGLNRYSKDIDTFLQFKHNPDDANSLSHESIGMINHFQSLIEDKDGYLWIATQNGLNRFDPEEGIFKHFLHRPDNPGSLSHNVVNAIYADSTGTLWVGTRSGLNRLDPTRTAFERYAHDPGNSTSLSHNEVHAVMEDGAGDIWIGTENGLNKFHKDSNSFVRYFHSPADHSIVADSKITSINRDKKGRLWLCHYTKGSFTLFDPGTHQAEFYIHDPENPDSLPTNDAKYVYEDRQGVIWVVSTTGGNICKHDVNSTKFVTYKQNRHNPHSLNGNSVLPIYEDSRGTLWIGTDKSKLNKYDRKTGRFTYIPIQGHHPYAFCEDSRGTFWVGETNGRLSIFDRRSETYLKSYDGLTSSFISHIAQDTQDPSILWLTTHKDGLVKFNTRTEEFKHFRHQPGAKSSLSNNSVWGFWQTDDTLWLGTWGGGLNEFHKKKEVFTVYKHDPDDPASISSNTSGNLLMTSAGDLYISTLGGGLNRFNQATRTFEHYSKSNGRFPSDDLTGLLEDAQGNLWIASSTEEVIRFDVRTKAFEIFGPADGIEIGGPWFVANHKTRDGQMWFGGPKGVTAFYPKNIQHNDFRPPVYITALTQGGAPIQTDRALERLSRIDLAWKKPFFEFKATALNYTRSENNRYRYKLEGWDADWFEAGVLRNGRYSNLPGGAYTLKIEGSNNDGLWCRPEQAVAVTVFVSRPFWKTGWFYLALGCVFLMVIGFALKYLAKLRFEIGERKQAEEALGASEKVVRDILENSRDILYKFNLKTGTYDYMSPSLEKYTGISVADYIEGGIELALSRIHPEDRVKLKTHIEHLLDKKFEDDMDPTIEYRFKNLDGKYRWFSDNRSVLRDEDDNALGVIGSNRDITSNKLAEEALSKQRYFLQKAQEMGKIGTWELDIEKNELLWTDETYKIFGLPVGTKLTYETFLDCVHPEDRQYVNTEWKASVAGKPYDIEHRLLIGGETKWVLEKAELEFNENGECIRGTGFAQDITERKSAETALRESENRYRDLIELNPDCIFVCRHGVILYTNNAMVEILGAGSKEDLIGRSIFDFVHPDYRKKARERSQFVTEKKMPVPLSDFILLRMDDGQIHVQSLGAPVEFEGKAAVLYATRDVTALKKVMEEKSQLEKQLQQAQKMESIGNLAGGIAHDFNNILFPIVGMAELLLEDLPAESLEYQNAREILKAGKRGSDLVKQILAFSRQTEHQMIPIRIQSILKEVIKLGKASIPADIKIVSNIQRDCGLILADPVQVHQIALNLITNAYHAVEQAGGEIAVRLQETRVGGTDTDDLTLAPGQYATLIVADTGSGIDPVVMDKIFEPYFTTKEQGKGTGLGLAVVFGIVKEHSGEIKVHSAVGRGTTFTVLLPLLDKSPESRPEKEVETFEPGTERILLVDDEEAICHMLKQMLARLGYRVTTRLSGVEALDVFRTEPNAFDLVITDMTMPNLTGDQLARELISIKADTPIVICTGFSERMDKDKADAIGIKGFLMKPIVRSAMARTVRSVLDETKTKG